MSEQSFPITCVFLTSVGSVLVWLVAMMQALPIQ